MHGMEGHGMGNGNVVAADSHIESSCLNRKEKSLDRMIIGFKGLETEANFNKGK